MAGAKCWLLLLACFGIAHGVRFKVSGCSRTTSVRKVHVIVTRHGLSCANVVNKFSTSWASSKLHANMKDPLLTAGGAARTQHAASSVASFLESRGLDIDAVLASMLARAVQTAALQYPARKVWSVPYISELGLGKDNKANTFQEQLTAISNELAILNGTDFRADQHWLNVFGRKEGGDWPRFREFLELSFLPEFAAHKPADAPIVLAVVTHSNLMMKGEIKNKCSALFPGKSKANNNQAVMLTYDYRVSTAGDDCEDVTTEYDLVDANDSVCELVTLGTPVQKPSGDPVELCLRDIGDGCAAQIRSAARWDSFRPFLEDRLESNQKEQDLAAEQFQAVANTTAQAVSTSLQAYAEAKRLIEELSRQSASLQSLRCLDGGRPDWP